MYKTGAPKKNIPAVLSFIALSFLLCLKTYSQTPPFLLFTPYVSTSLSSSVDLVNAGDGTNRLFVVRQGGIVRIISGGVLQAGNFLNMADSLSTGGERGLLSLAFHPNFASNRYFFVYYTTTTGDIRITRFQTLVGNPNVADQTTGVVLLTIPHPTNSNHNGGKLVFGSDGNLYFGTGDGGGTGDPDNNAQNGNSLLGKMMRINVDNFTTPPYYTIPADNPYVGNPAVRDEIFAMGLRNPWRWSFDRLNHDMWIADVGQGAREEIDFRTLATAGGVNYGWRCYEGNLAYNTSGCQPQSSYESPIFDYPHNSATGGFVVTGGYVYRGLEYAALYGYYICIDYATGNAWLIKPNGSGGWNTYIQAQATGLPTSIVGFGEDEFGILYALSQSGVVYKVGTNSGGPVAVNFLQFTAKAFTAFNELRWKTTNEQNLSFYEIEYSLDAVNYISAGRINALNSALENNYSFQHSISGFTKIFYRIKITDKQGHITYSNIIGLDKNEKVNIKVYPTVVMNKSLYIESDKPVEQLVLFSVDGKQVFQTGLNNASGTINISIPDLQGGLYFVQLKLKDQFINSRILVQ